MKTTIQSLVPVVAALAAVAVFAAEPAKDAKPGELTPQQIQQLTRDNNGKLAQFKRTLEGIPNWHNDKMPRNPEFINSNVTEMVKLIKLPVGAATGITEAGIQALAARAYAQPLNLKWYDNAKKHYLEAIRLATKPFEKATLSYDYADYMLRAAMEGDSAQWNKAKADTLATPGLEPAGKLDILARGIAGMDFEQEGWKIAAGIPELHGKYYAQCLQAIANAGSYMNRGGNPLAYAQSDEHKLELAEKAIADTAIPEREKKLFFDRKFEALKGLERFADVENMLLARAASTNAWQRAEASAQLGDFYVERAQRYYGDPEPTLLRKALASYAVATAHQPLNGGYVAKQVAALMQLGEYDEAIAKNDLLVSLTRDKVADKSMNKTYADCHYYKGDYAKACEYYDKFDDGDQKMQRRYAEALYAVGRYDDAIAHIKRCYNDWSFKEANKYFIRKIEEKKATAQQQ